MAGVYVQFPSVYKLKKNKGLALSSYKSENPTHLNLKKDKEVMILERGDDYSWAENAKGKKGWVPSTMLRITEVPAALGDVCDMQLRVTVNLEGQVNFLNFDNFTAEPQPMFSSKQCVSLNEVHWDEKLNITLQNKNNYLARAELDTKNIKKFVTSGVFSGSFNLKLKGLAVASCKLNFRCSTSLELLMQEVDFEEMKSINHKEKNLDLLPGEVVTYSGDAQGSVMNVCLEGTLYLTNNRLFFTSVSRFSSLFNVTLLAIDSLENTQVAMKIITKDLRNMEFKFYEQNILRTFLENLYKANGLSFCFSHYSAVNALHEHGWDVYSPYREFTRIGVLDDTEFRVSEINSNYQVCESYPSCLVFPSSVSDKQLKKVAKFRSKARLPTLTWYKETVGLYRSSQPLVGFFSSRCKEDEDFMLKAGIQFIIDARPKVNARANKIAGRGFEHSSYYSSCKIIFANMHNIHKVNASYQGLLKLYDKDDDFYLALHNSKWLHYLKSMLVAGKMAADFMTYEQGSVLVHCSDGWDRTPQITCIAQLLVEPFYRTYHGFQVLICKDWLSFGHKFRERCFGTDICPVFVQFLDGVHQVLSQFPNEFQFSEDYLIFLADSVYSGTYGTFMSDNEKDSQELRDRTRSVWSIEKQEFFNSGFQPSSNPILPLKTNMMHLKLWKYFTRWQVL